MTTDTETSSPSLAERYSLAAASSNLRLDANRPGAVNLLIAAGVAARGDQKASRVLGGALGRLLTEWDGVERPQRMRVLSLKEWIDALPLIQVGERQDKDGKVIPIMGRDKDGARKRRQAQQEASDHAYRKELMWLAQRLPARFLVREVLFAMALKWKCEEPEALVAGAIAYWLASKCRTCGGTGSVQAGHQVRSCSACHGGMHGLVPGADAGRRMVNYMDLCCATWRGALHQSFGDIHKKTVNKNT